MPTTYHRVACSDYLVLCPHAHATVISAAACISAAGEYIIAQEKGAFRALDRMETLEYEYAIYGNTIKGRIAYFVGHLKRRLT